MTEFRSGPGTFIYKFSIGKGLMKIMKKVLSWLDLHFEAVLMSVFLCGVVVMMSIHVFFRYVVRAPLTWSEEATRYMFIWFVFTGMSYGIRNGTHIRVNIIEVLCPKVVPIFSWIQDIVGAAFVLYLTPAAVRAMQDIAARNQTSAGLHLPMVFVYGSLMLALILSIIRVIQRFALRFIPSQKTDFGTEGETVV